MKILLFVYLFFFGALILLGKAEEVYEYEPLDYDYIERVNREAAEKMGQPMYVMKEDCSKPSFNSFNSQQQQQQQQQQQEKRNQRKPPHEHIVKSFDGSFDALASLMDQDSLIIISNGVERLEFAGSKDLYDFWIQRWKTELRIEKYEVLNWDGSKPEEFDFQSKSKIVLRSLYKSKAITIHAITKFKLTRDYNMPMIFNFNFEIIEKEEFAKLVDTPCHFLQELGYYINQKNTKRFVQYHFSDKIEIEISENLKDVQSFSYFPLTIVERPKIIEFLDTLRDINFPENNICVHKQFISTSCKVRHGDDNIEDNFLIEWDVSNNKVIGARFSLGAKPIF